MNTSNYQMDIQTTYQKTLQFAALKHSEKAQTIPGTTIPYVVHLCNVAMEIMLASEKSDGFDLDYALKVALLHDTLEDTNTTFDELAAEFGSGVAEGVLALTKNQELPAADRMLDSLIRIRKLRKEIHAIKLADRITNMQFPPLHWDNSKKKHYLQEAMVILENLKGGNAYLENRLRIKILEYEEYIDKS